MDHETSGVVISRHDSESGTLASYVTGFIFSIALTLIAYLCTTQHLLSGTGLIALIVGLALIQFFVQIFFFLHLGKETKPRWKLLVLCFMVLVVLILVLGSLWIMHNLNYRMMPTQQQINEYMQQQSGDL